MLLILQKDMHFSDIQSLEPSIKVLNISIPSQPQFPRADTGLCGKHDLINTSLFILGTSVHNYCNEVRRLAGVAWPNTKVPYLTGHFMQHGKPDSTRCRTERQHPMASPARWKVTLEIARLAQSPSLHFNTNA